METVMSTSPSHINRLNEAYDRSLSKPVNNAPAHQKPFLHEAQRVQLFAKTFRRILSVLAVVRLVYETKYFAREEKNLLLGVPQPCPCGCVPKSRVRALFLVFLLMARATRRASGGWVRASFLAFLPIVRAVRELALLLPLLRLLFWYGISRSIPDTAWLFGVTAQGKRHLHKFVQVLKARTIDATLATVDKSCKSAGQHAIVIRSSLAESKQRIVHSAKQRTTWAESFAYDPLIESDEIRLVEIHPGRRNSKLECTIVHTQLHICLRRDGEQVPYYDTYEALSYTWGDPALLSSIICYYRQRLGAQEQTSALHKKLYVTANCLSALKHLRLKDRPRRVWVDAICINQHDMEERNAQVRMMARIYRTASRTVVYLGSIPGSVSDAMSSMFELHGRGLLTVNELLQHRHVDALQDLLSSAWFSRIWVLQEVYMAKSTIALLGSDSYDWKDLVSLVNEVKAVLWNLIHITIPYVLSVHDDNICAKNLFDLLCGTRHCAATDPRDKYFALLSMVEDADINNLAADYTKDLGEIFTKLAIYLLEHIGLDFLTAIEGSLGCGVLPSWVPDWSISTGLGYLPPTKDRLKRAGGARSCSIFKLEERVQLESRYDENLANYLLEQDQLDEDLYSFDAAEPPVFPPSQRVCGIACNWDSPRAVSDGALDVSRSEIASELKETVIEHMGAAKEWSNFTSGKEVYPNPVPEDWCVVLHRYCTPGTSTSPSSRIESLQLPILTVRGILLDEIVFLTSKCDLTRVDLVDVISEWHRTAWAKKVNSMMEKGTTNGYRNANIKECYTNFTISLYQIISWGSLSPSDLPSVGLPDNWTMDGLAQTRLYQRDLPAFKAAAKLFMSNRRLFVTAEGRIGLCSVDSQIGDVPCIFSGAVYPCVLRRMFDSSGYSLVGGACYIDGLMDGEAFQQGLELHDIVIW